MLQNYAETRIKRVMKMAENNQKTLQALFQNRIEKGVKKKEIHRCFWMAHNEVGMTLKACRGTSGRMGISFFYITKYVFESQMINVDSTLDG